MLDAKIFDKNACLEYENSPWDRKYKLGLYFTPLHELTGKLYLHIGIRTTNGQLTWYKSLHAIHDAFSAIKTLLKELDIEYQVPYYQLHSVKNRFKALKLALASRAKTTHDFKNQDQKRFEEGFSFLLLKLDKEITTSQMLLTLGKVLVRHFSHNTSARWMIPVRIGNIGAMEASYLGIEVNLDSSLEEIQQELSYKLKNGEYWGYLFIAKLGLFFGKHIIRLGTKLSLAKKKTSWFGSMSNLGNLGEIKEVEELYILPSVRWHRPIGVMFYKLNGIQYVTLNIHAGLKNYDFKKIKEEFLNELK